MKTCFKIAIIVIFCADIFAQEITLPIVKNGNWFLLKQGKEIQLPENYTYINFFDNKGYSYFQIGQNFGLINEKGKEIIVPKFSSIESFGKGFFACKLDTSLQFINIEEDNFNTVSCQKTAKLSKNWISIEKKSKEGLLINLENKLILNTDSTSNYQVSFDHLIVFIDSLNSEIYNSFGEKLFKGNIEIGFKNTYSFVKFLNFNYFFDNLGFYNFPENSKFIEIKDDFIHYQTNGIAYLVDRTSKKEIFNYPADLVKELKTKAKIKYYEVEKNGLVGIINSQKKIVIPQKYDEIEINDKYINTYFNTLTGIYSLDFNELIPCNFKEIDFEENFIRTKSINLYQGLYSKKTFREILPALYDNIEINKNIIKAKYNGILTIVEIDTNHKIINKIAVGKTYSLNTFKKSLGNAYNYDQRLFEIGWFFDSTIQMKNLKWGLKNSNGLIILKPTFVKVEYVVNAPFSIVSENFARNELLILNKKYKYQHDIKFTLINYSSGKALTNNVILHIDTMDFRTRKFARFADIQSSGIITESCRIHRMTYVDFEDQEIIRYCKTKNFQSEKVDQKSDTSTFSPYLNRIYNLYSHNNLIYKDSKWNFLDKNGDSIFKESFDFAQNFYKKTALVKKANLWGIVNADSIVVPIIYHSIKRLTEYNDTVFIVSNKINKVTYLDSNAQILTDFNLKFDSNKGVYNQFKNLNTTIIIHSNGKRLLETQKTIKFYDFNYFGITENKTHKIYNENGEIISEISSKPVKFITKEIMLVEKNGKFGLLSLDEDTLIPLTYKEIEYFPPYFLAKNNFGSQLYSSNFNLILETKNGRILIDTINSLYLLNDAKKIQIFDAQYKRISKFKSKGIFYTNFYNKLIYSEKEEVLDIYGKASKIKTEFTELIPLEDGYFYIREKSKFCQLYDKNLHAVAPEISEIKKITYLQDNLFGLTTKNGYMIYDNLNKQKHTEYKNAIPNWEEGIMLVENKTGKYRFEFLNRSFENIIGKSFSNATIFRNGFASIVEDKAWTIIDKKGLQKSYPNFNEIENLSLNIFKTCEKINLGIVDSNGKIIIPIEFEKINFINQNIIQGIKEGKIYYFDYQGRIIYE